MYLPGLIAQFATWLLPILAIVATIALWRIGTALSRIATIQEQRQDVQ